MDVSGKSGEDRYNLDALRSASGELGYDVYYFETTESTMGLVNGRVNESGADRVVFLTDHQTDGVGRVNRVWLDKPGSSLMFSVLLRIPQDKVAYFADLCALAITEIIKSSLEIDVKIKYPNDLVFNDRKYGGILVKNIYDDKLNYLGTNVGIGINVHYTQEELDEFSTDYKITCLDLAAGKFISRQNLLIDILGALRYLTAEVDVVGNPTTKKSFDERWRSFSSLIGREIVVSKDDRIIVRGRVGDTRVGEGIEIEAKEGKRWVSLFDTDMKIGLIN